jgi:hypothetical protein
MNCITANDLKNRGLSAIKTSLAAGQTEVVISVGSAARYVVMELTHYHYLRECELEAALAQSRADLAAGCAVQESTARHVKRATARGSK